MERCSVHKRGTDFLSGLFAAAPEERDINQQIRPFNC